MVLFYSAELHSLDERGEQCDVSYNFFPPSCLPSAAIILQRHDGWAARVSEVPTPPQTEASAARHR